MARPLVLAAVLGATVTFGAPPGSSGGHGPPGQWTRVTAYPGRNIDEPAIARTPDGVLHVLWLRSGDNVWDLMHSAVGADGQLVGEVVVVLGRWRSLSNPFLLVAAGGALHALAAGVRGPAPGDRYDGAVAVATSADGGATWTLAPGAVSAAKSTGDPAATRAPDGTPVVAWAAGMQLGLHVGLDGSQPDRLFPQSCCPYHAALATDAASGAVVLGWYSNATAAHGLYTRAVVPGESAAVYVPASAAAGRQNSTALDQRMALVSRSGAPGVYVAYCAGYPVCASINLWRHGDPEPLAVARAPGARFVNAAPGPDGRLWAMWMHQNRLHATRTNRAATRMGPIVSAAPPAGTAAIWKLKGDGARGPLDLLAAVTTGEGLATWHTQLLPALSVAVEPAAVSAADRATLTLTVTDAGDPVAGARIEVAGRAVMTEADGRGRVDLPARLPVGTITARATLGGYVPASTSVTITPARVRN